MKKTLKYIGISICVYAFFYLITAFIIWDFDVSTMYPGQRFILVFFATLGAVLSVLIKEEKLAQ